jgi:hypothetical protein
VDESDLVRRLRVTHRVGRLARPRRTDRGLHRRGSTRLLAESSPTALRPGQAVWACTDADDIDLVAPQTESVINPVPVEVVRATLTAGTVTVEGCIDRHPLRTYVGGDRRLDPSIDRATPSPAR